MRSRHLIKRGNRYHFVCRVPRDLQHLFPSATIWKSLKADDAKDARLLAGAEEYRTQQLFMQLRSGMLDKALEKRLIALYLKRGIDALEAQATGQTKDTDTAVAEAFDASMKMMGLSPTEARERYADFHGRMAESIKGMLADRDTFMVEDGVSGLAVRLKEKHGIKLTAADQKALSIKFLNADKQLHEAESSMLRGEWSPLEMLKEKVERDLAVPYYDLKTVLEKYRVWYIADRPDVKPGTRDDMEVECRVLLEIFGNISAAEFNTMDSVTKLKGILQKYPKNKVQRYGDKSIHSILRTERGGYEVIGPKTANEYIKRAKAVVDYANKAKMLRDANVYEKSLFRTDKAAEEQRPAYDNNDVVRLIDAICTYPLWRYNPPKPERFWTIL